MGFTFDYGVTRIKDLRVQTKTLRDGKEAVTEVTLNDEPVMPTSRFWNSLHLRFGFTSNIFRYFTHAEVFQRISEKCPNDQVRWCLQRTDDGEGSPQLLAVTNPTAALIQHDDLCELLDKRGAQATRYHNGVISSDHEPRLNPVFQVSGDGFRNKFVIDTPIDGFGKPSVYLAMMRLICSNGAIAMTPAFRSELAVGRGDGGVAFALTRVLDGFNNEDGYAAMRDRFEAAAKSWASVHEVNRLYKVLVRLHNRGEVDHPMPIGGDGASLMSGSPIIRSFHKMTGDLSGIYGLSNLDTLSAKRQRTLPAACKVYELLNFASEVATHHATSSGHGAVQAFIGDLISGEYDLEGTVDQFPNWRDFFIGSHEVNSTLASRHTRSGE
jgi:hypothetical protein